VSHDERRDRHMAWLLRAGNADRLASKALACWRQHGRGFWLVSHAGEVRLDDDAIQPVHYFGQAALDRFPDGPARRDVAKLLRRYDPTTQFVLVVEELDGISAYRLMLSGGAA
jgi:hypothetical protein